MIDISSDLLTEIAQTKLPSPELLRRVRKALDISQTELAIALGFGTSKPVSNWENDVVGGGCLPTPLAWNAMRYLVGLVKVREVLANDKQFGPSLLEGVEEALPKSLRAERSMH